MNQLHVIFGTGPAGAATVRALVEAGKQVRAEMSRRLIEAHEKGGVAGHK